MNDSSNDTVVVVGNGMLAARAVDQLASSSAPPRRVVVFGAEPVVAYSRVLLPVWLAGDCALHDLELATSSGHGACAVERRPGERVVTIDRARRFVTLEHGAEQAYDHLVLATGSMPDLPTIAGTSLRGVSTFRTSADVAGWLTEPAQRTVVVGGGVLGLETACALRRHGAAVTLLHRGKYAMDRQLDGEFAATVERYLIAQGVQLVFDESPRALEGEFAVRAVLTNRGLTLPAERVIFCTGVTPNSALARAAGLPCGRGVRVDASMHTSDPAISAIGECAEQAGQWFGVVEPLYQQLDAWLARRTGRATPSAATSRPVTTLRPKLLGIDLFVAGDVVDDTGIERLIYRDHSAGVLRELRLRNDRLVGVRLLGATEDAAACTALIASGRPLGSERAPLGMGCLAA